MNAHTYVASRASTKYIKEYSGKCDNKLKHRSLDRVIRYQDHRKNDWLFLFELSAACKMHFLFPDLHMQIATQFATRFGLWPLPTFLAPRLVVGFAFVRRWVFLFFFKIGKLRKISGNSRDEKPVLFLKHPTDGDAVFFYCFFNAMALNVYLFAVGT